jgi:hypothetical protein
MPPDSVRVRSSFFAVSENASSSSVARCLRSRRRHSEVAAVVVERLLAREEPVEVEVLRREPDREPRLGVVVDGVVPEHADVAGGRLRQPGRAVDQRRLAGAVGAEQPEELARADLERDALERLGAGRVALDEVCDLQCRGHCRTGNIGSAMCFQCGCPHVHGMSTAPIRTRRPPEPALQRA